jgi:hypothetical protein
VKRWVSHGIISDGVYFILIKGTKCHKDLLSFMNCEMELRQLCYIVIDLLLLYILLYSSNFRVSLRDLELTNYFNTICKVKVMDDSAKL